MFRRNPEEITTPSELREELLQQFGDKIVPNTDDFEIGYYKGQTKLWIRTDSDLKDAWSLLCKGSGSLWLHRVKEPCKQVPDDDSDTRPPPSKRSKAQKASTSTAASGDDHQLRMEEIIRKLQEKYGSMFTSMQYRGWAELLAMNAHNSYDSPPPYPMFNSGQTTRNKSQNSELTAAFTSMAEGFAGYLKPKQSQDTQPQSTAACMHYH